ncbi:MAG TPA: hypothetical protein VGB03_06050 [Acidimicrobiales bacterium]|jgi:hypothetical protein
MSEYGGTAEDLPTRRLGTYLAVVSGIAFVAHLLGIGVRWGFRIDVGALLGLWLALSLRNGKLWARTILVVLIGIGMAIAFGGMAFADIGVGWRVLLAWGVVSLGLELCAVAFTLPEEGVSLGLPEHWRPWAASRGLHLFVLVSGLVGVLTGY